MLDEVVVLGAQVFYYLGAFYGLLDFWWVDSVHFGEFNDEFEFVDSDVGEIYFIVSIFFNLVLNKCAELSNLIAALHCLTFLRFEY